ncbi:249_t:CDS:1, partial [Rhizophagus irregularis]
LSGISIFKASRTTAAQSLLYNLLIFSQLRVFLKIGLGLRLWIQSNVSSQVWKSLGNAKTSVLVEAKCAIAALKVIGISRFMPIFVVLSSLQ